MKEADLFAIWRRALASTSYCMDSDGEPAIPFAPGYGCPICGDWGPSRREDTVFIANARRDILALVRWLDEKEQVKELMP